MPIKVKKNGKLLQCTQLHQCEEIYSNIVCWSKSFKTNKLLKSKLLKWNWRNTKQLVSLKK